MDAHPEASTPASRTKSRRFPLRPSPSESPPPPPQSSSAPLEDTSPLEPWPQSPKTNEASEIEAAEPPSSDLWPKAREGLVSTEEFGRAVLWHAYPDAWHVLLDAGQNNDWVLLAELPTRPTDSELTELVLPSVKARRAAFTAALRALREVDGDGKSVDGLASNGKGEEEEDVQEEEGGEEAVMRGEAAGLIYGPSGMAVEAEGKADRSEDVESEAVEGETTGSMAGNGAHEAASLPTRTLVWEQIEDSSGSSADLALYHDVALLRQRCHGDGVSFAQDAHGVHIIQPFDESEAAEKRARSEAYGRLNGNVRGACLLLADKRDGGVATVEAFSVQRDTEKDERALCAAALLRRAAAEAAALGQRWLIVQPLPRALQIEGTGWLEAAGFAPAETMPRGLANLQAMGIAEGSMWKRVSS